MKKCVVFGGGGHASVVLDAIQAQGVYRAVAVTDPDPALEGTSILGVPVIGDDEHLSSVDSDVQYFVIGVGSIADNSCRKRIYDRISRSDLVPATVIHPSSVIASSAKVGPGTVIFAGVVVNPGVLIQENVIVNSLALVEHDCVLEDHVHGCPGARVGGDVRVREGAFIGAGAVIKQGLSIGSWATVAMGAAVVRPVTDGATVAGVPARVSRTTK